MRFLKQAVKNHYLIRLYKGEDIMDSITKFLKFNPEIKSGSITGIGAVEKALIGFYDGERYRENSFKENLELLSLIGNVAQNQISHLHGVFGRADGTCIGGHIFSGCIVSFTCEIMILATEPGVERAIDPDTNLNLLNLPVEI